MYGLSLGIAQIGETLPRSVFALLSGLNAAVVGVIALAAVQLAEKAITDPLTRLLVFLTAAAGLLYNALWYFPLLLIIAAAATVLYDFRWLHGPVKAVGRVLFFWRRWKGREAEPETRDGSELREDVENGREPPATSWGEEPRTSRPASPMSTDRAGGLPVRETDDMANTSSAEHEPRVVPTGRQLDFSWRIGVSIICAFLASFVVVMVLRGTAPEKPLLYRLFANMYLAGTIIFGGGPVVIPLLREYVVAEGWVSPRDFLIGLALIQAFPGPNFNFAVYLGGLTAAGSGYNTAAGGILGYLGIFAPGIVLVHGTMGVWGAIRGLRSVKSALRGMNAAAVGLIYTAVYRIWQIGWIDEGFVQGVSLANDPWWVVVTATSYVGGRWFNISPPVVILLGAAMGLIRYVVVHDK
jgi:chromate transport protein ChrA